MAPQRAMVLGRLYGGAILIGDGEMDTARLAQPLDPACRAAVTPAHPPQPRSP